MTAAFNPEAWQELLDAAAYYQERGGDDLEHAFLKEMERITDLLDAHPEFGKITSAKRRSYSAKRFPYTFIYRATDTGIRILAVVHQSRKPGYWRGRQ